MISEQDAVDDGETADSNASLDARHAAKMAKKKAARDRMIATKHDEKGLIIVHTGAGKGKSSSAFGMILRCVAHGFPCAVVQFIKGAWDTGERRLLTGHFGDLCQFHAMGEGFTWETQDRARAGWLGNGQAVDRRFQLAHGRSRRDQYRAPLRLSRHRRSRRVLEEFKACDDPCRPHRAQRQTGTDRHRRPRH